MQAKRRVVGIGETILDIIFRHGQPVAAVPGGSCFNSLISMGRAGLSCAFAGYSSTDAVGQQTRAFLTDNGVSTEHFALREGEKSSIALAYLNEGGDADYVFYKLTPTLPADWTLPTLRKDDILILGSYFAICEGTRAKITALLEEATRVGAIVYYDINFRRSHREELEALWPAIRFNYAHATVVRGSADDFEIMLGTREATFNHFRSHPNGPIFVLTAGADDTHVCTPQGTFRFPAPRVDNVVSTVGAGDNFNAGFIFGLITHNYRLADLPQCQQADWQRLIHHAHAFAAQACQTTDNYIPKDFI